VALLELLALLSYRLGGLVVRALAGISTFLAALVVPVFLAAAALHRAQEAEEAEPGARPDQMAFLLLFLQPKAVLEVSAAEVVTARLRLAVHRKTVKRPHPVDTVMAAAGAKALARVLRLVVLG
jgi:hypothetical protein